MHINEEAISGVLVITDADVKPKKCCGCWSDFRRLIRKKKKPEKRNRLSTNDKKENKVKEEHETEESPLEEVECIEDKRRKRHGKG